MLRNTKYLRVDKVLLCFKITPNIANQFKVTTNTFGKILIGINFSLIYAMFETTSLLWMTLYLTRSNKNETIEGLFNLSMF